ncbi:hypothetical protein QVD17_20713 [Tagetes erecta]|uniref:F-box domain-containing protein n=1 Tax=Tagetes erecta TaxID=13708 RepID=A0AAD8KM05_TARER|nr:hypothetical protein QVD17_20713 [Tagetes erecta]
MISSLRPDLTTKVHPEPPPPPAVDLFDLLPEPLLLSIFNQIADVKTLGRCSLVSKRFHQLIPHVQNVVVRVDCVISDDDSASVSGTDKSRGSFLNIFRLVFGGIVKPIQGVCKFLYPKTSPASVTDNENEHEHENENEQLGGVTVTHHSPTQVLKSFIDIRCLRIELPSGELGVEDDVLLKWRAEFGSTLDNCVMLGASSVIHNQSFDSSVCSSITSEDNGSIPESFYTNGGLKLRVVWTISSLIAASARHYLLQSIVKEHKKLESLVLTDVDRQGVLCMNKEQLEELRVKPLSASSASKRTLVPALNMKLWYAPHLELPDGRVLKGATLVAIRPSEQSGQKEVVSDGSWVSSAFEEPYGSAARMLVKRRTYCLEMNSF